MKLIFKLSLIGLILISGVPSLVEAQTTAVVTGNGVNFRKSPKTDNNNVITKLNKNQTVELLSNTLYEGYGCTAGWYNVKFNNNQGYICASFVSVDGVSLPKEDEYGRPWTSPQKAIEGGALFIAKGYINKGQFTSYLKKFNVNPNNANKYRHQYASNLQAPSREASISYEGGGLNRPLEFIIPVYQDMPDVTSLPGKEPNLDCQETVLDSEFESQISDFPESYRCKLRLLHQNPNYKDWTFKAMQSYNFNEVVTAEQKVCAIQGGTAYYELDENGNPTQTEKGWYKPNKETVAYYLDPRNFLVPKYILQFENLTYLPNHAGEAREAVEKILVNTYMKDLSILDNKRYVDIFMDAGKKANVNPVYLASLARQETGNKSGAKATSGARFTYQGVTYEGLYNFFNIGAYSSAESPVLAGLVWANGGSMSTIIVPDSSKPELLKTYPEVLNERVTSDCIMNIRLGTIANYFKINYRGAQIKVLDSNETELLSDAKVTTGSFIIINEASNIERYVISVNGDVNRDGKSTASDYVLIKNNIMDFQNSSFDLAQELAADVDANGKIGASDYVLIKKAIMR